MRLQTVPNTGNVYVNVTAIVGVSALLLLGGTAAFAQAPASTASHATTDPADQNKQLAAQVAELRAQVAQLQAAIKQAKPAMPMGTAGNKPMGMMDDMKGMGMPAGQGAMRWV